AEERDAGLTAATLVREIAALDADPADAPLVVAYEPTWAIGHGPGPPRGPAAPPARRAVRAHLAHRTGPCRHAGGRRSRPRPHRGAAFGARRPAHPLQPLWHSQVTRGAPVAVVGGAL